MINLTHGTRLVAQGLELLNSSFSSVRRCRGGSRL